MQKERSIPTPLIPIAGVRTVPVLPVPPPRRLDGLRSVASFWGWALKRSLLRALGRSSLEKEARSLRVALEGMGGVWVKLGQLIAMRPDIFPQAYCDELSRLQDHATGFPYEDVQRIVAEELGHPLEQLFEDFDPQPFAAASIGQIHRARLRDSGVPVAIKIQRPTVAASFKRDLTLVRRFTTVASRLGFLPHVRWDDLTWELERTLLEELDYRLEASYLRRMRKRLRKHRILVPKAFDEYSGSRVLTMEFIRGVLMSNYLKVYQEDPDRAAQWLAENEVDTVEVAQTLYLSHCRQLFEDRMFHADLHPGNIVLLRKSRIALIDFGSVGVLEESFLREYSGVVEAISRQDFKKAADLFLVMAPTLPKIDLENVREEMIRSLRSWSVRATTRSLPYHEKSLTQSIAEIGRIYAKYRMATSWAFMRVNRAQLTMDASLMYLWPDMNYMKVVRRYFRERGARELKEQMQLMAIAQRGLRSMTQISRILEDYSEEVSYDVARLRRSARTVQAAAGKFAEAAGIAMRRISWLALILLFWLGLTRMHQSSGWVRLGAIARWLDYMPRFRGDEYLGVAVALFLAWWALRSLARHLLTPDQKL